MAQEERYAKRDGTYAAWHRRLSTRRFVGMENAQLLAMIDIDALLYVETDDDTKEPLAFIEVARDVGQDRKPATITRRMAVRCGPPMEAYVVLYTPSATPNPADDTWPDIESFRIRRVYPEPETDWKTLTPAQWAEYLLRMRRRLTEMLD